MFMNIEMPIHIEKEDLRVHLAEVRIIVRQSHVQREVSVRKIKYYLDPYSSVTTIFGLLKSLQMCLSGGRVPPQEHSARESRPPCRVEGEERPHQ